MMKFVDDFLNRITMYRLVLYYLIGLIALGVVFGFLGLLPYNPYSLAASALFLLLVSLVTNKIFSRVFNAPTNVESVYISALILALIITPLRSLHDFVFLGWAAVLAMSSKYIFAVKNKHIFNPVAIAVALTTLGFGQSASWWVGNAPLMPFVLIGGLLIVRKIRKEDMIFAFILTAFMTIASFAVLKGSPLTSVFNNVFFHSSLWFFAFVMLTEPLTTPPTYALQIMYGIFVGILFSPQVHIGTLYSTPELALIAGNIFSYLVSPKIKLVLQLHDKIKVADDTYDFIFPLEKKLNFAPGQYMEWTLPHEHSDDRGNRRYFTIASSPTEPDFRIGVKFYQPASSYKKAMLSMDGQKPIVAGQLAGDFTLPKDDSQKLVFVAGGIGITPFRSILKYLIDMNEKRDIIVVYSNKTVSEIAYADVLTKAQQNLSVKVIYTLTDLNAVPAGWQGKTGRVNDQIIREEIPDFSERIFYLSGPHAMVDGFNATLKQMGVVEAHIKKDFFPGFV